MKKHKDWKSVRDSAEQAELEEEKITADDLDDEDAGHEEALSYESRDALETKLLLAEKKAEENWDKATRAVAELDNIRRRAERDVANAHRFGVEKLVLELIPVMDSLEQALNTVDQKAHPEMAHGIELTMKLLLGALQKHDVTQLDPVGQPFNPQEQEAMTTQVSDDVPPNTVLIVFQKGYKLSDRVVRPARVIVSKAA